ncbi:YugN family protein [Paludifilum halophilum]|nr:YugN family protein [Paludifilum halophilum]
MIPLESSLENIDGSFQTVDRLFNEVGFNLGGGYEYDHGYYDKALDWEENKEHQAYLRVPVTAIEGSIGTRQAVLRIGKPFVLMHKFRKGPAKNTSTGLLSGSFNQFTEPVDKDAGIDKKWLERAQSELNQLERRFNQKL